MGVVSLQAAMNYHSEIAVALLQASRILDEGQYLGVWWRQGSTSRPRIVVILGDVNDPLNL